MMRMGSLRRALLSLKRLSPHCNEKTKGNYYFFFGQ